jgi:hypothetical protein
MPRRHVRGAMSNIKHSDSLSLWTFHCDFDRLLIPLFGHKSTGQPLQSLLDYLKQLSLRLRFLHFLLLHPFGLC